MTLGVAAVARRLGVATGTLRTWDRRYGLGPSAHEAGTRRRYTVADLARLTLMRRLMIEGVATADAARTATETGADSLPGAEDLLPEAPAAVRTRRGSRTGGGRVVATRDAGPAARGLARAAMGLDSDACTALLRASLARSGVVPTWNELLVPVLVRHRRPLAQHRRRRRGRAPAQRVRRGRPALGPGRHRPAPQRAAGAARGARARGPPAAAGRARRGAGRAPGGRPSAGRPAAGPRPGRRGEPHRRPRGVPLGAGCGRPGPAARRGPAGRGPAAAGRPARRARLGRPGGPAGHQPGAPTSSRPSPR